MEIKESVFRSTLITNGRVTGKPHFVELRAVRHNGKIYVSRHRPDADWFKNALKNPAIKIVYNGQTHHGMANQVTDEELNKKISELKYTDKKRAKERRVAIEITLEESELSL